MAAEQERQVERYARLNPGAILYDPGASQLIDIFSGKTISLDWRRIGEVAERTNSETGKPYLVLVRDDAAQIVLSQVGIAFAPIAPADMADLQRDMPPAVCFQDYALAAGKLAHFLLDHPEDPPAREHVTAVMFCLAVLAGARAVGFDVSGEERQVEKLLAALEARGRAGG
jgi:hypothetical protein